MKRGPGLRDQTPPIGQTVLRMLRAGGSLQRDWILMRRIDHGPDPQDAEIGVLCWGSDGSRHSPGEDYWEEAPTDSHPP
jgi:hypothetical protein